MNPGEVLHCDVEFGSNSINIINIKIHERVRSHITRIFRQMERELTATKTYILRHSRSKAVLTFYNEAESGIPPYRLDSISHIEDWNKFFSHCTLQDTSHSTIRSRYAYSAYIEPRRNMLTDWDVVVILNQLPPHHRTAEGESERIVNLGFTLIV